MSLGALTQQDFGAGACPGIAPHLIPPNGCAKLVNFLIDEDGSPYKRSGTSILSGAHGSSGLTFEWDGWLLAGKRTVVANSSDFGVLSADDSTIINLGGAGMAAPGRGVEVAGILFIDGGTMYAGSRKTANYTAGTVAGTNGSTALTGSGTSWAANVDVGMILTIGSATYVVAGVGGNTSITLNRPFADVTASGLSYTAAPIQAVSGSIRSGPYAAASHRLISMEGSRAYFSALGDPTSWTPDEDYHELTGGVQILGGDAIGDGLMLFTTRGAWSIANMELSIVDPFGNVQQPETQAAKDLVLWGKEGLSGWRGSLVVPGTDGVWLIGPDQFTLISDTFSPLYTGYVRAGYKPGLATVIEGFYLLPVIKSNGDFVDMLVCRLDRPVTSRGQKLWPWMQFAGAGVETRALTTRVGTTSRSPVVLAAELGAGSRVLEFGAFEHEGEAFDHDDSPVIPEIVLRDIATGDLVDNVVKKIRARYELLDVDDDPAEPKVLAYYGTDARPDVALWDEAVWDLDYWAPADDADLGFVLLEEEGPASMGETPAMWRVNRRMRFVRPRLKVSGGSKRFVLRHVQVVVRPSGRM